MNTGSEIQIILKDINAMYDTLKDQEESKNYNITSSILFYFYDLRKQIQ